MIEEKALASIMASLEAGERRFCEMESMLSTLCEGQSTIRDDVAKTRDIVEAWAAVKTIGRFVKWSAGIIASFAAIILAVKTGIAQVMR